MGRLLGNKGDAERVKQTWPEREAELLRQKAALQGGFGKLEKSLEPCPRCHRDFIFLADAKCRVHCNQWCCRDASCQEAPQPRKAAEKPIKRCIVCNQHRLRFERFAPCTKECPGHVYPSSRPPVTPGLRSYGNGVRVTACALSPEDMDRHRPTEKARIHIKYCSLRCYNSDDGHDARRRAGVRLRERRHEAITHRSKKRQESGYYREYKRRRAMRDANMMRYGSNAPESELRLREASEKDQDFLDIFGDQGA